MWDVIFIFILVGIVISVLLLYLLYLIKSQNRNLVKRWLIRAEISGYLILCISLGGGFISNMMHDSVDEKKEFTINQKLNYLWMLNLEKINYSNDNNGLYQRYNELNAGWKYLNEDNSFVEMQDTTAANIQGILYMISTVLIAAGRAKELLIDSDSDSNKKNT
jgi:hypothetical protein